jgi:hypothetical protein
LRATELGRILVTHDKGLFRSAIEWQRIGRDFSGIVFAVQSPFDIGATIEYLELLSLD